MKLMDWIGQGPARIGFDHRGSGGAALNIQADTTGVSLAPGQTLPLVTTNTAGVMSPGDKTKLEGLQNTLVSTDALAFQTRAQVTATAITDPQALHIKTAGYNDTGDGGGGLYKRVASEPAHEGKVQSADGTWWELVPQNGGFLAEQFGALNDGVTDDYAAISAAIAATPSTVLLSPGTGYRLSGGLVLPANKALIGSGGYSQKALLTYDDGVGICLQVRASKFTQLQHLTIDMSAATGMACGILFLGVWNSRIQDVDITGPGAIDPALSPLSYGLALRSFYNEPYTPHAAAAGLDTMQDASSSITFGTFYNNISDLRISDCTYGILLVSREEDDTPTARMNQNMFSSCNIVNNWHGIWMQGCGGGNCFMSVSAENCTEDAVTVEEQATGTSPVFICGELSATGEEWRGPGLLLNLAGITSGAANNEGEDPTHIRASGNTTAVFGRRFTHDRIIEPDFQGLVSLAPGAVHNVNTDRTALGTNVTYMAHAWAQGAGHSASVRVQSVGSSGPVLMNTPDLIGSHITWQVTGEQLQIINNGSASRTVEFVVEIVGAV